MPKGKVYKTYEVLHQISLRLQNKKMPKKKKKEIQKKKEKIIKKLNKQK